MSAPLTHKTQDDTDAEILEFLQLIDDSDNKTFDPSTYFQFKEEKEWDISSETFENETNETYQNLMNIRFDSLELSLGSVPLHERLDLDDLFLKDDDSWMMLNLTRPIVPKTIKSVVQKSLVRKSQDASSTQSVQGLTTRNSIATPNTKAVKEVKAKITETKPVNDGNDIDDFFKSLEDEDAKPLPRSNNIKKQPIRKATGRGKASRKNKTETEMVKWLDDVLND
ncbi:13543_t:CDS:2 [Cetraspora pellucida]|uniref:13543_t:CDS:1 n=1 Tax=Cetraspora pellucida TaxID=1433469 RepID=A0A9N9NHN1_9GLOM|nr:13543_t:CDS:2 [Cetraspora pellucida]